MNADLLLLLALLFLVALMANRPKRPIRRTDVKDAYLDAPLFTTAGGDTMTRRDGCENIIVFGRTGGGKSTFIRWLLSFIIPSCGLLYIAPKAGDAADIVRIAEAFGRRVVFVNGEPGGAGFQLFAPLAAVPLEDKGVFGERVWEAVSSVINRDGRREASGNNAFFVTAARQFVRFAIDLLALAEEPILPETILRICRFVPASAATLDNKAWRAGYLYQTLVKAFARAKALGRMDLYDKASEYFNVELANLAENTKSCVQQEVSAIGDLLTRGPCHRALFAGDLDPLDCIRAADLVVVDAQFVRTGDVGRAVAAGVLYAFQQAALERTILPDTPLYFLACDEFQEVVDFSAHSAFAAVCRSQRVPLLLATQCLNSLIDRAGGEHVGKARAEVLIANCTNRFIANPTPYTAKWVVENLYGRTRQLFFNSSVQTGSYSSPLDFCIPAEPSRATASANEQMQLAVEHQALFGLATGGGAFDNRVQLLWFRGRPFADGRAAALVTVNQKELL